MIEQIDRSNDHGNPWRSNKRSFTIYCAGVYQVIENKQISLQLCDNKIEPHYTQIAIRDPISGTLIMPTLDILLRDYGHLIEPEMPWILFNLDLFR